jgi:uncharacterized protein YukE
MAGQPQFALNDERIVAAYNKVDETARDVTKQAQILANLLETIGASWTGAGASSFRSAQTSLNEDHDAIRRLLDILLEAITSTKNLSNANDVEVVDSFKPFIGAGPGSGNTSGLNNI